MGYAAATGGVAGVAGVAQVPAAAAVGAGAEKKLLLLGQVVQKQRER